MNEKNVGDEKKGTIRDWLVVTLLTAAMIFSFIDRFTLSLLLEPIKRDLQIGDAGLGLLNGVAFGLFYAAMGLPLGWLADRWSRKGTIMVGVGVWTLATAACGLATTFGHLLVARIGVGAGEAGLAPASYGMIYDRFPRRMLARAMSVFQLGSMVGAGTALAVAGALYQFFVAGGGHGLPLIGAMRPWQQTFVAVALPGIGFLALLSLIREPARIAGDRAAGEPMRGDMMAALRATPARYALLFFGMSGVIITAYALLSWLPTILVREYGWSAGRIGASYGLIVVTASPAGLLVGGVVTDWLVKRGTRGAHVLVALAAAVFGFPAAVALSAANSAGGVLAIATILHFTLAMPIGVIPAYIQIETPARARGQVSALYVLVVNVMGLGVGPTLIGFLSSLSPDQPSALRMAMVMVVSPGLTIGVALLAVLVKRERSSQRALPTLP